MYMRNPTAVQNYLREPDSSTELLRCFPGGICREWEEGETREGREERQGRETQGREGGERHARERETEGGRRVFLRPRRRGCADTPARQPAWNGNKGEGGRRHGFPSLALHLVLRVRRGGVGVRGSKWGWRDGAERK